MSLDLLSGRPWSPNPWFATLMTKVLVVDDDPQVITMLTTFLTSKGYDVMVATSGAEVIAAVSDEAPNLVLLDIALGAEDGREVLGEVRTLSDVPVIFLTGRALESERVAGLKLGADDYIVKPFSLAEVAARIDTVLRRANSSPLPRQIERPVRTFGDLEINELTHEVKVAGRPVDLTSREFGLLAFLATSPRQAFSRVQLLEMVWDSSTEWHNEATVTEHVRRIRAKIEVDPDRPRWITTVRGIGYRFDSETSA